MLKTISASLLLFSPSCIAWENDEPWFCHDIDCPNFTNSTIDNIEIREYPPALWASTNVSSTNIIEADNIGFDRLFDYISGANDESIAIDMTSPVTSRVIPGAGPNCNSTFIVSFFVPFEYQDNGPPEPTSSLVYIESREALNVAVSEFSGYAPQAEIIAKAAQMEVEVEDSQDLQIDNSYDDSWFFAGYDPPFRLTDRHNEVWVPVIN
eukprot:CAMPEP_0114352778 /NCGR_PEP_ID=MMETSP0101-20121206/18181_1 /TAXON_ID=38822 ORGANISM="Pteridomonas danica, Strain PT" /NCGR_SAMPLE_ID=MMETSP0101 /ASSEMBLY_ACC=CAM_ASM_000211 /LENGTH=208 /DNA_ID=CAMNT_0001493309 /DNA_START=34 /DNA_END=657 /DNA_ORIENTATION=-